MFSSQPLGYRIEDDETTEVVYEYLGGSMEAAIQVYSQRTFRTAYDGWVSLYTSKNI